MTSRESRRLKARSLLYYICAVLVVVVPGSANAQAKDGPIDVDRAADYFAEARLLETGNPWPDSLFGPLLFVDPSTRFVVASAPDSAGILRASGSVYVGELPSGVGIANTAVEWNGRRWTMLLWPPPAGRLARGVLLAHELFHRLSPKLGLEMANPTNEHLETAEGRIWLRLEFRALALALTEEGERRREAVLDALRFRAHRHARFPAAAERERALELNEGLAEYTGVRAALGPAGRAGWAARLIEQREVNAAGGGVSRNFAYATGPAYGLLLDAAIPGWEREVASDFDLAGATAHAYAAGSEAQLAAAAPGRTDRYDGNELARFETERAAEMERRLAVWQHRFFEGPVLRLPSDSTFGYSFNPNAIAPMEGVGQVLLGGSVQAGWGALQVKGDVLIRRADGKVVEAVVPAPVDPEARPLVGDGWVLELEADWELVPDERPGDWTVRQSGS